MYSFSKYKDQYKSNLRLALPVVLTQLGQILTQVADNLMVGRYGGDDPVPLAAVSFGGAVFFILFIAAIGIALGMTPLVGELYAQGDREKSAGLLQNGILFYTLLGFAMAAVQYAVIPLMYHLGQPVEVVDIALAYRRIGVFATAPVDEYCVKSLGYLDEAGLLAEDGSQPVDVPRDEPELPFAIHVRLPTLW